MRKHIGLFAAAAVAVGGMSLAWGQDAQEDGVRTETEVRVEGEQDREAQDQPMNGLVGVTEREANNIRGTLSTATEAAIEGDLGSLAQRLTSSDEARLADAFEQTDERLEQLGQELRDAFQARYGEEFSIDDREAAYPAAVVQIRSGLTQDAILVRGEDAQQDQQQQQGQQMQRDPTAGQDREGAVGDQPRPEGEENVATVIFSSSDELAEVHVPLVNEGTITDAWRIDIPLKVDAEKIRTNLHQNLSKAMEQQDQWPEDMNEGYRHVTHLVLLALLDKQEEGALPAGLQEQIDEQRDQLQDRFRQQEEQLREQEDQEPADQM